LLAPGLGAIQSEMLVPVAYPPLRARLRRPEALPPPGGSRAEPVRAVTAVAEVVEPQVDRGDPLHITVILDRPTLVLDGAGLPRASAPAPSPLGTADWLALRAASQGFR